MNEEERSLLSEIDKGKNVVKTILWFNVIVMGLLVMGAGYYLHTYYYEPGFDKAYREREDTWTFLTTEKKSQVADDLLKFLNAELPAQLHGRVEKSALYNEVTGFLQRKIADRRWRSVAEVTKAERAQAVAELVIYLKLQNKNSNGKVLLGGENPEAVDVDYLIYEKLYQELKGTSWKEESDLLKSALRKLKPDKPAPD
jgi:hypothetical protein